MGNFEKLVVLTVLFLTAIVLAVSLRDDGVEAGSPDPLGTIEEDVDVARGPGTNEPAVLPAVPERRETAPAPRPEEPVEDHSAPVDPPSDPRSSGLLLDSTVHEDAPPAPAKPAGPSRILVSDASLRPTALADFRIYTVRENDTWAGLAQRFYRSTAYLPLLHNANEDLERLVAGEEILVPVFDFGAEAANHDPVVPAVIPDRPAGASVPRGNEAAAASTPPGAGSPTVSSSYEVQSGDNLSTISQKVYGTAHRWKEIYEANRDKLDSPDWVQVGMKLRIPR